MPHTKNNQGNELEQLNRILYDAIEQRASDIHFEPNESGGRIRFRIDGVLKTERQVEKNLYETYISELKMMNGLNVDEKKQPQDGRIILKVNQRPVDIRGSVMPTIYGENMTLRIWDRTAVCLDINKIGFNDEQHAMLARWQASQWGGVFFSGPVGSGKTTSMYCCINQMNKESAKVCTIENPVEFPIPGVVQTQVDTRKGVTFSAGLRCIQRMDPDVIMVSELRDIDTANLIFNAILTGHLVFTQFHTETATGVITRLLDMGAEPFLIKSSLKGVINQRLVRKLCEHCKEGATHDKDYLSLFNLPKKNYQTAKGCEKCGNTGYRGRLPIYEFFELSDATIHLLLNKAPEKEIRKQAIKEGMKTIWDDGLTKALDGLTSINELARVIGGPL